MGKKIAIWLALGFVVYFVVTSPATAGAAARGAAHALGTVGSSVLRLFDSIRA
jgi:hypothetical protein